ncbi:MAG: phasin family protein [Gammaproteobacteria bacterium]
MQTPADVYTTGFNTITGLVEANLRVWNQLAGQQTKLVGFWVDCGQRQLTLWNRAEKPADFFAAERDIAREVSERCIEYSSAMFTGTAKAAAEMIRSIEGLAASWELTPMEGSSRQAEQEEAAPPSAREESAESDESKATEAARRKRSAA